MSDENPERSDRATLRKKALSRWDNEGGASREVSHDGSSAGRVGGDHEPILTNAELVQLRVRVIALENLVIALLSQGGEHQVELVGKMADYISPRPGATPHPMTIHAAAHMIDLAERAVHFRASEVDEQSSSPSAKPGAKAFNAGGNSP